MDDKNTKDLFLVASQYCTFIENIASFSEEDVLDYLLKITPLLYLKANLIADFELEDNAAGEQFLTEEQYQLCYLRLREKLESVDFFEGFNFEENETVSYSLCEILTDTYQDLKDFLLLYAKNTLAAQENAVWLCRTHFVQHWGKKITALLPYLHFLNHKTVNEETESFDY
ncbi:MAG: DUF5063 domain-containing protein [Lentimicrobiaceae bacterium]|nr:DUF5063 domain-containing protein [Lentimicrobiaceae bacterium]